MQTKKILFYGAMLLSAAMLWGCGSSGSGGSSVDRPEGEIVEVGSSSCKQCHGLVTHNETNPIWSAGNDLVGVVPNALVIRHECEDCHGGGSAHHGTYGQETIPYPIPTAERCAVCHEETEEVLASTFHIAGDIPACASCHAPLELLHAEWADVTDPAGVNTVKRERLACLECHNNPQVAANPFYPEIYERFETSRHASQNARSGLCSACHSNEGGIELLAMERMISRADLATAYTADTVDAYLLPVGSDTIDGVQKKTCATCHNPHEANLRGDGDITAFMLGDTGTTTQEATVVFSAEFNLCTACHMVDIVATNTGSGNNGRFIYEYELSDAYSAANLIDATSGTYDFSNIPFYHDGASGNGRTMIDTHFGGEILSHLVDFAGGDTDITIKGYNVNAGARNACTSCHDPHTAGKMLAEVGGTYAGADNIDNPVIGYAEGLGDFHNSYQTTVSYRQSGCAPCHTGDNYAAVTLGVDPDDSWSWGTLSCRACHDLAIPNTEFGLNNAPEFAQVREFPLDHVFAFNALVDGAVELSGGVVVPVADLGVNQICFECHKGRTPGVDVTTLTEAEAGTRNYDISYLHYAPSFAILWGADSGMVATYPGESYSGRFTHGGTPFGCVDCHDVHNTNENHAATNKMTNPEFSCAGCHGEGQAFDAVDLQARTQLFSERLLDTILVAMVAADGQVGLNATLQAKIDSLLDSTYPNVDYASQEEELMAYIQERQVYFPSIAVAHAATTWKVFTYEDGAPHGQTHGHGGSWAHNSKFAREMMYDAILSLSGDVTGLDVTGTLRDTP
ncbi:cytochrome c3 family protein [Desulfuromonas sp. KJ2020]|uniref:cytochrome c3 family protein n=1 Tax=Desulfuromonas sp. KJ2020 TaxID=2919173 RepID=UPI0020A810A5|nr:cytochrome c3 family protein [Desulfuromonas sp. KJ2020]MCP3175638.1 cytochrome c3 family protein [Desulfuromonas sp. KJ2020]